MTEDVLAVQLKLTECACATPVPVRVIVAGEFEALLVTLTLPVALPTTAGAKVTLTLAVCPGDKTSPVTPPPALKPAPETVTFEIVTLKFPMLVRVTF
jgi:hypothetical protein